MIVFLSLWWKQWLVEHLRGIHEPTAAVKLRLCVWLDETPLALLEDKWIIRLSVIKSVYPTIVLLGSFLSLFFGFLQAHHFKERPVQEILFFRMVLIVYWRVHYDPQVFIKNFKVLFVFKPHFYVRWNSLFVDELLGLCFFHSFRDFFQFNIRCYDWHQNLVSSCLVAFFKITVNELDLLKRVSIICIVNH